MADHFSDALCGALFTFKVTDDAPSCSVAVEPDGRLRMTDQYGNVVHSERFDAEEGAAITTPDGTRYAYRDGTWQLDGFYSRRSVRPFEEVVHAFAERTMATLSHWRGSRSALAMALTDPEYHDRLVWIYEWQDLVGAPACELS